MRHFKYLKYLITHKFWVAVGGWKLGVGIWRLVIHDLSKFLPSEWGPYTSYFYGDGEMGKFLIAWNYHQKRNKHHWQYWALTNDSGIITYLPIPTKYLTEMVADWAGAGRAIKGKWDLQEWYDENKEKIKLENKTRERVERLIKKI